jgi:hypothetical protein
VWCEGAQVVNLCASAEGLLGVWVLEAWMLDLLWCASAVVDLGADSKDTLWYSHK